MIVDNFFFKLPAFVAILAILILAVFKPTYLEAELETIEIKRPTTDVYNFFVDPNNYLHVHPLCLEVTVTKSEKDNVGNSYKEYLQVSQVPVLGPKEIYVQQWATRKTLEIENHAYVWYVGTNVTLVRKMTPKDGDPELTVVETKLEFTAPFALSFSVRSKTIEVHEKVLLKSKEFLESRG